MPFCLNTSPLLDAATHVFDPMHAWWESAVTRRRVATLLIMAFLGGLAGIELGRQGLLPPALARMVPHSHFHAVDLAFTLVLILEVVSLVFTLPCSFSRAMGKQFEILALILLRSSFKELVNFSEPVVLQSLEPLYRILSDGVGALLVFALLGLYYRLHLPREDERQVESLYAFVAAKKIVSLIMLAAFVGMGGFNGWHWLSGGERLDFFAAFYTLLIFSDILLVLIAQRYLPSFQAVFRNSGYALATLLMRLALAAPPYVNAALGVGAAVFAICLTLANNAFYCRHP